MVAYRQTSTNRRCYVADSISKAYTLRTIAKQWLPTKDLGLLTTKLRHTTQKWKCYCITSAITTTTTKTTEQPNNDTRLYTRQDRSTFSVTRSNCRRALTSWLAAACSSQAPASSQRVSESACLVAAETDMPHTSQLSVGRSHLVYEPAADGRVISTLLKMYMTSSTPNRPPPAVARRCTDRISCTNWTCGRRSVADTLASVSRVARWRGLKWSQNTLLAGRYLLQSAAVRTHTTAADTQTTQQHDGEGERVCVNTVAVCLFIWFSSIC